MKYKYIGIIMIVVEVYILYCISGCSPSSSARRVRCGDGICDNIEQMHPNYLCPQDCGISTSPKPEPVTPSPSDPDKFTRAEFPFAFGMATDINENLTEAKQLGLEWVRLTGPIGIVWDMIEDTPGEYNWSLPDQIISTTHQADINILITVLVVNKAHQVTYGYAPSDMEAYTTFLTKAVERYDGDGIDDAPGAPVVHVWQIGNEIDSPLWKDSYENYALLLKASYSAIKSANPNAKVAIAGMLGPTGILKYAKVINFLQDSVYFDIFDIHWHAIEGGNYKRHNLPMGGTANFDDYISEVHQMLHNAGYTDVEIWITEMSASHAKPAGQTETTQAIDLVKRYLYSVSRGVSVIFWVEIHDVCWEGDCDHYFGLSGLITQTGQKKLAYYTYKLMIATLEDVDWNTLEIVQEEDQVYIYKLTKKDTSETVWIAWWDYFDDIGESKTVTLPVGNIQSVRIIDAIPNATSGAELYEEDYPNFFHTENQQVTNGTIRLTLQENPVFIVIP